MTRAHKLAMGVAMLCALHTNAAADPVPVAPFAHLHSPRLACRDEVPTDCIELRPGYYYDEPEWSLLDTEIRRLQTAETRLTAENKSLRDTASGWTPGWRTLLGAVVTGVALGVYLDHKL